MDLASLRRRWPTSRRRQVATVLAIVAIFGATLIASSRLLRLVFEDIDILAYLGLFVACWIGAGGALVPVPGVRPISWVMVIQQGAALDPVIVTVLAAGAMVLGQSSYFLVTRRAVLYRRQASASGGDPTASSGAEPGPPASAEPTAGLPIDGPAVPPAEPHAEGRLARARRAVVVRVERHTVITVFLVTALPSPFTTVATTAAASIGTPYARWLAPATGGYLVFAAVLAFIGQGLVSVVRAAFP